MSVETKTEVVQPDPECFRCGSRRRWREVEAVPGQPAGAWQHLDCPPDPDLMPVKHGVCSGCDTELRADGTCSGWCE